MSNFISEMTQMPLDAKRFSFHFHTFKTGIMLWSDRSNSLLLDRQVEETASDSWE